MTDLDIGAKRLLSIIIPVYNEENNVERAYSAIIYELNKLESFDYEIIFTDNHSTDNTFKQLTQLAHRDPKVRVIRFARNFGFQHSILTGYRHAKGDAAIQIDCDLEDPPSIFPEFIRLWEAGHDVVVGIRVKRSEPAYMASIRRLGYRILDMISDIPHEMNAGDFRLVDRSVLDQLQSIHEAYPYVRGLISELASHQVGVSYIRDMREFGESKFPLKHLIKMGLEGVFAYSVIPLKIASYLGIFTALLATLILCFYIFLWFFSNEWPAGFTTITVLTLFGISLNALFLGVLGEYIGRIYNQIRRRPVIVIEKTLNFDSLKNKKIQRPIEPASSTSQETKLSENSDLVYY